MPDIAASRRGPDAALLATLGQQQLDLAEDRYHMLLAAVQKKYKIDAHPSGPRRLHKVSFEAYKDRDVKSVEAALDPRDVMPQYIQALHQMFRSNAKTLEGGILYSLAEPQCWPFIQNYHSSVGTSGRSDWDSMFASLRTGPSRSIVPCMFVSTPFGCHIPNDCPFRHPPSPDIAATRSSLVESRRTYLTKPNERSCFTYVRNNFKDDGDSSDDQALMEEAKLLEAICDNGRCAKKERPDGSTLLKCKGCGWARYCSQECQKLCWKRHKKVCINIERLIEEDALWTMEGRLLGQPALHDELRAGLDGTRKP